MNDKEQTPNYQVVEEFYSGNDNAPKPSQDAFVIEFGAGASKTLNSLVEMGKDFIANKNENDKLKAQNRAIELANHNLEIRNNHEVQMQKASNEQQRAINEQLRIKFDNQQKTSSRHTAVILFVVMLILVILGFHFGFIDKSAFTLILGVFLTLLCYFIIKPLFEKSSYDRKDIPTKNDS